MRSDRKPPKHPVNQLEAGRTYFSDLNFDVSHFAAVWHALKVGERLSKDMNTISGSQGISIADFHLLGALMMDQPNPMRATDLALALHVSNAVISTRIAKLASRGFVARAQCPADRRVVLLRLTEAGSAKVYELGQALERDSLFIEQFRHLPSEDQASLSRILGDLHSSMARFFVPNVRPVV